MHTMEDRQCLRIFDITVDNNDVERSVRPILIDLKPEWEHSDLESEKFLSGFSNSMTCFYHRDDPERADAFVVRVYGKGLEKFGYSKDNELLVMQLAGAAGAFPPVYAAFNNGVVYRYFPGRVLRYEDFLDPQIIKKVTSVLYRFHHVDMVNTPCIDHRGNRVNFDQTPKLFDQAKHWISAIPDTPKCVELRERFYEYRREFTHDVLMREYNYIQSILSDMDIPLGLNHCDVHMHNLILNDKTGEICLIDVEMACISYHIQDLGRFFSSKPILESLGMIPKGEPDIDQEVRLLWLRGYLEAKYESEAKDPDEVTQQEMDLLDLEVKIFEIIALFEIIMFAGMVDDVYIGLDILGVVPKVKCLYYSRRDELLSLKEQYKNLNKKKPDCIIS